MVCVLKGIGALLAFALAVLLILAGLGALSNRYDIVEDGTWKPSTQAAEKDQCEPTDQWDLEPGKINHLDKRGNYLRVQFWVAGRGDNHEYEAMIDPAKKVDLNLFRGGGGTVYVYSVHDCTADEVREEMTESIKERGDQSNGEINWEKDDAFREVD